MTSASIVLAALTAEPTSTSDLYDRVGYPALVRAGLVPYESFRAELVKLSAAGLAQSGVDDEGATTWRLPTPEPAEGEEPDGGGPAG
jgi:hypothetical protein